MPSRFLRPAALLVLILSANHLRAELPVYLADLLEAVDSGIAAEPFFDASDATTVTVSGDASAFSRDWMDIDHPKFDRMLRVNVLKQTDQPWGVVLHSAANPEAINQGDWVLVSFYARGADGAEGTAPTFKGFIERNSPTWVSLGELSGQASGEWNRYVGVGRAKEGYTANSVRLSVHLGFGEQALDMAGFAMIRLIGDVDLDELPFTTVNYDGMGTDAEWRTTAAEMIEENRMGDLVLEVTDLAGEPLEGVQIELALERHAYEFGTFFSTLAVENTAEAARYRDWMQANFNYATTPVYWADWGWANPVRRQDYLAMASWLQDIGMPARGHVLLYPGWDFAPRELRNLSGDPVAFNARIIEHLEEIVPLMKARGVREYDVINELRQLSDFTDIVGLEKVVSWFHKVREIDPDAALFINENSILVDGGRNIAAQDHYFDLIEYLLEQGTPLDGIGMQGHSSEATTPPTVLWSILDRFASFGLPIRITEYDLGTRDLEGQAAYDRDFTTAIFSHPATVGMTRWGFYEPQMWRPEGALIDTRGDLKPNGEAHRKLLYETWHTQVEGESDAIGLFRSRAFFGTYRVRITIGEAVHEGLVEFRRDGDGAQPGPLTLAVPLGDEISWIEVRPAVDGVAIDWTASRLPFQYRFELSDDLVTWQETNVPLSDTDVLGWHLAVGDDPVFLRFRTGSDQ